MFDHVIITRWLRMSSCNISTAGIFFNSQFYWCVYKNNRGTIFFNSPIHLNCKLHSRKSPIMGSCSDWWDTIWALKLKQHYRSGQSYYFTVLKWMRASAVRTWNMLAPYGVLHAFSKLSFPVLTNHLPGWRNTKAKHEKTLSKNREWTMTSWLKWGWAELS